MSSRPERATEEVRTENATGGQKGSKPSRFDLLPPEALDELARVYGMGAKKYSDTNYLKGYEYRKSLAAMLRHINEWNLGNTYDDESGLHHLSHAAWHCFTLMTYEWNGLGEDDRMQPMIEDGTINEKDNEDQDTYKTFFDPVEEQQEYRGFDFD